VGSVRKKSFNLQGIQSIILPKDKVKLERAIKVHRAKQCVYQNMALD